MVRNRSARARTYVERSIANDAATGIARYALALGEGGDFIGFSGFAETSDYLDFGYRIAREHWGRGFATEAGRAVLRHGFADLGFASVVAISYVENAASIRVIEKLGFTFHRSESMNGRPAHRYLLRNSCIESRGAGLL